MTMNYKCRVLNTVLLLKSGTNYTLVLLFNIVLNACLIQIVVITKSVIFYKNINSVHIRITTQKGLQKFISL